MNYDPNKKPSAPRSNPTERQEGEKHQRKIDESDMNDDTDPSVDETRAREGQRNSEKQYK